MLIGYGLDFEVMDPTLGLEAINLRIDQTGGHDTGYLSWVDLYAKIKHVSLWPHNRGCRSRASRQKSRFFKASAYDIDAGRHAEAPSAISAILTFGAAAAESPKSTFKDIVLVITEECDHLMCDGYCTDILQPAAPKRFPAATHVEAYVQPDVGHGMNHHRNATGIDGVVTSFLDRNAK